MLSRRLQPFRMERTQLHWIPFGSGALGREGEGVYDEYGFEEGSKQGNFFRSRIRAPVVAVLTSSSSPPPSHLSDDSVVARLFGEKVGSDLVLWHVSVRRQHVYNDSDAGRKWGVYGIEFVPGTKVRWRDAHGKTVDKKTAESAVRGSPNPYATRLVVEVCLSLQPSLVRQHEAMPCAQLFDKQYTHRTHPATHVLFRSLGFRKPKGLDAYVWNASNSPPFQLSWRKVEYCMSLGMPCVSGGDVCPSCPSCCE